MHLSDLLGIQRGKGYQWYKCVIRGRRVSLWHVHVHGGCFSQYGQTPFDSWVSHSRRLQYICPHNQTQGFRSVLRLHPRLLSTLPPKINAQTRLASRRLIKLDILAQLLQRIGELGSYIATPRLVDLQRQREQLKLEHLVLDLADLEDPALWRVGSPRCGDGLVEPACFGLGVFGGLARFFDDG